MSLSIKNNGSMSIKLSGSLSILGGTIPVNPSSLGDLKLRFLAGDYSSVSGGTNWNPTVYGSSEHVNIYYASGWSIKATDRNDGNIPSFNGQGSIYVSGGDIYNAYNGGFWYPTLDAPGGSTARTFYMVAYIPNVSTTGVRRMFSYGNFNGRMAGFIMNNGYIYGAESTNPTGTTASTVGAPISSGVPFVASYSYAAGSDLKDSPIYVNGAAGSYGAGVSGIFDSPNNGSGIVGNQGWGIRTNWTLGGDANPDNLTHYLADILVFNTAHDSATRQGVESWLMNQYGL